MQQIIVTHRDGSTLKLNSKENVSAVIKATQNIQLLGQDVVDISVKSAKKLSFFIGDKITIIGRDYTLNTSAKELKISENDFQYDMQFEGVQYDLMRANYSVNVDTTTNEIQDISGDSITGDLKIFLDVLISNANRVFGSGKWAIGSYPLNTKTITLTFSDADNCLGVLQTLCSEQNFNTEFKIEIDGSGNRTINIGESGNLFGHTFEYGKGKGVNELSRERVSSSNIITRLNCFGSSKNIVTPKYRASKLCLPLKSKSQSFLEDSSAMAIFGIWENTKDFEEIYPHRTGVISSLGSNVFEFFDTSMDFDLTEKNTDGSTKYLMAGTTAKLTFNTGNLAGYEFEVSAYDHGSKKFTIISQTDQNDYIFPSTTTAAFQFAIGDEYVLTDIYMPQSYIDAAESELAIKGAEYLAKYSQPLVQYGLILDSFFLKNQVGADVETNIIWVGDYIPVKDPDIDVDKTIRVKSFTRDLLLDYSYQLAIADLTVSVSFIDRVISGMNTVDKVIKINDLNDPAKARRNWKDAQEVLSMIFDVEGDYYSEKIKPLSIETSMLSVGAKSMQFGLEGTIFQPNYAANKNRVVYTGGSLVHYSVLDIDNNPRIWNISDGDIVVPDDNARYIYAKCSKSTSSATMLFSTDKIAVESDANFYHFLIGILNSVDINNTRALALMYGFTTVNGRFIRTGRIQSADGNTYFDLDTNEIGGKIFFKDGLVSGEIGVGPTIGAVNAGMNGEGSASTSVRFWAGETPANKATAPFRVQQDGKAFMTDADVSGKITADSGKIGNWQISGGGMFNDTDTAYIIARKSGIGGYSEARIGSNVISSIFAANIPAWFMNTLTNPLSDNVALLLTSSNGNYNKAIQATGDIVMTAGDAISSKINYINLFSGSVNVIYINKGLRAQIRNTSGATRSLYLPALTDIRKTLLISPFLVKLTASASSSTLVYYVEKDNGLIEGDCILYSTSGWKKITNINKLESTLYDKITLESTLGISISSTDSLSAIHEFCVEINIVSESSESTQQGITLYPNGGTWYDHNGNPYSSYNVEKGDSHRVLCYTYRTQFYYQSINIQN